MRVFVTGGTGLVGKRLVERLLARGDQPVVLSRRPDEAVQILGKRCSVVGGDPTQAGDWMRTIHDCDAVVHLAGENLLGRRWNAAYKERLRHSRTQGTKNVAWALRESPRRADGSPKVLASASAIGYYGPRGDEEVDETAPAGSDFLAQLCRDWEQATAAASAAGVRVAHLRTGIVLDARGGPLPAMLLPFRLFAGGPIGAGRHYVSWIHHADETGVILLAIDNPQAEGPINLTAPHPVPNREFARTAGRVLHRPSFLPTPAFALRVAVGEASYVLTTGQRVIPRRALQLGYVFKFPELEGALRELLDRPVAATD
jgi:uncharacterized protein (TIGR01777 family)